MLHTTPLSPILRKTLKKRNKKLLRRPLNLLFHIFVFEKTFMKMFFKGKNLRDYSIYYFSKAETFTKKFYLSVSLSASIKL